MSTRQNAVLVLNCGSSSVKYSLLEPESGRLLAKGLAERIGSPQARLVHDGTQVDADLSDHATTLRAVLDAFAEHGPDLDEAGLVAVGHRVVHGGELFREPTVVDDEVVEAVESLSVLAPLHNPANLEGIRVAREVLGDLPHVAVFDTAFHATIPARAATYAVPKAWRTEHGVRRYGFHGTSHAYVSRTAATVLGTAPEDVDLVVLHLGNGASACAVSRGRSVDTSMGLTPLAGLVMGTRSGDVDPALAGHLDRVAGMSRDDVELALNKESGLLGLAGVADMREVTRRADEGDDDAALALDVFCYRIRCYVGAYLAALGRLDAVVFTGGIGENSPVVRTRSLAGLEGLGIAVDDARNAAASPAAPPGAVVSPDGSGVAVLVVPTDEEREIARQTLAAFEG